MTETEKNEVEIYLSRTIDETAPELKRFLKIGDNVLDVGCGPGTITLDVAEVVYPGNVVGLDHSEERIAKARELGEEQKSENVRFKCGDANELPFEDNKFDVVYSHTVLHYFWNPLEALSEQKRVLRNGGWLIAAGVRDWGLVKRYPNCPNWESVLEARYNFCVAVSDGTARYDGDRRPCFAYTEAGRHCPQWFSKLGLINLQVKFKPGRLEYAGAPGMETSPWDLLPWDTQDEYGYNAEYKAEYEAMIDQGFIERSTINLAMEEAKQWFSDPGAFHVHSLVFVAGMK